MRSRRSSIQVRVKW